MGNKLAILAVLGLAGCAAIDLFQQQEVRLNGLRMLFAKIERLGPLQNSRMRSWSYDRGAFIIEGEDGIQINGVEIFAGPHWMRIANYPVNLKAGEAVRFSADMSWKVIEGLPAGK